MTAWRAEELGLGGLPWRGADPGALITGLAIDSRQAGPGDLFFALPGTAVDGAEFAQYAVRKGAVAVVATEAGAARLAADLGGLPVPVYLSERPRAVLAHAAAAAWPRQPEVMVAVTGTNGKTSVGSFLRQIWAAAGHRAASLGTTGVAGVPGLEDVVRLTTPDPLALHPLLDRLAGAGVTHAAMEASSHGLAQHRVDGVRLAAGALTNITRDHLDYHATQADYVAAKMRLFAELLPVGAAAVVHEGPHAAEVGRIATMRGLGRVVTAGPGADANLRYRARLRPDGLDLEWWWRGVALAPTSLNLLGAFQAENVAVAVALALETQTSPGAALAALPGLVGVPGRMERVARRASGAQVVVDYAHTPDALRSALAALRPHLAGRLVVVGGAGGDRDPGKRRLMGAAMAEGADEVIVTDDNPRSEDPGAIRAAVLEGCPEAEEIGDRAEAILAGVDALSGAGDALLIAGKGHETGQEVGGRVLPFDDAEHARAAVAVLDREGPP